MDHSGLCSRQLNSGLCLEFDIDRKIDGTSRV